MRTFQRTSLALLCALLGVTGCLVPGISLAEPSVEATSGMQTVLAIVAQTQRAASAPEALASQPPTASNSAESPTRTSAPTLTQTPSTTPTAIVFSTLTPVVAEISVFIPTNCRIGPGKVYDVVGALLVGKTAQIYGTDPTGTYWYIANPDSAGEYCWVWGRYATLLGPTGSVPVYTPLPTPTASSTATPAPAFEAAYEGLVSCSPEWWPEISLKNTGLITFRSLGIIVKDTAASTSVSDLSDGFGDSPDCSSSKSKAALQPGKTLIISPPAFGADPSGHKLRATLTLCSETGQNGVCVTETITFKP